MDNPSKCKNCQWYNKPYWSIINPCDNCPRENTQVEILTRWQDPCIEKMQEEINKLKEERKELYRYTPGEGFRRVEDAED